MIKRLRSCIAFAALAVALPLANAADVPIRMGVDVGVNSLPFWIANERGLFAKHGLRTVERTYDSGFLGLLAIGANEGDTSSQSDTPTLTLTGKGIDAVVVAVMARSADNYKIVGKKDIRSAKDLKGRKYGMTLGSACEYVGVNYLNKNSLSRTDVNVVGGDPSELAPLLARGDLDAACFWEPWGRKTIALSPSTLHVIGTGRDIYAVNMYLTVRRKFAEEHPDAVVGLLEALKEANAYIASHPQEAADIIKRKHRVDEAMARDLAKDFQYELKLDQQSLATMRDVGKWLVENKKLQALPDWKSLIDTRFLRKVEPAAVTLQLQ
jgi:NitT/TauT family transport system substrate-binding protein